MTRVAFLHTGAVVIAPVMAQAKAALPDATLINYLDDRIVADLGDAQRAASVADRLVHLAQAAREAGADVLMLTCSSISGYADDMAARAGLPVLRIDEAMADRAVATGTRIAVIATLQTTLTPTVALLRERAELAGVTPTLTEEVVDGAFAAVSSGDRARHDELVAGAIRRLAAEADVVVLAQASMVSAAEAVEVPIPVLTSVGLGIARLAEQVAPAIPAHDSTDEGDD